MKPRSIYFVVGKTLSSSWFQCLYSLNIIYSLSFDVVKVKGVVEKDVIAEPVAIFTDVWI